MTNYTLKAVKQLSKLKVLNISGNNITTEGITVIKKMTCLTNLICHNNCFKWTDLFELSCSKTMRKLSIGKNKLEYPEKKELEKIEMELIPMHFPNLTHIKLNSFCKINTQPLEQMSRLICLTMIDCPPLETLDAIEFCDRNRIYFNENEE